MVKKLMMVAGLLCVFSTSVYGAGERLWLRTTPPIGTYGLAYNPANDRLYYINFYAKQIQVVSSDSLLTNYGTIPCPNNDSACTDIKYCSYDNTFWILNNWRKRVYKVNTSGTVLRYFNITALDYPVGLAWDEANRRIYISDRRTTGGQTQYIYSVDTLGNITNQFAHPCQSGWYGSRCLDYRPAQGSSPAHLLNVYTFFNSAGTIDSACIFAINPQTAVIINSFRYVPLDSCNIRGIAFDPRNGNYWISTFQYGT